MREASQTNSYRRHKYLVNMSDYERSVECYVLIEIYMHVHFVCDIQLNHLAFFYMYKMYTSDNEKIHHTR
jgi:hypothetical protein